MSDPQLDSVCGNCGFPHTTCSCKSDTHECVFDFDGSGCRICGKTVSEMLGEGAPTSDTPRTDASWGKFKSGHCSLLRVRHEAEKLERELNIAKHANDMAGKHVIKLMEERDAWRECAEMLACVVDDSCDSREAREAISTFNTLKAKEAK